MADGVFDIDANKFERKPAPDTFDPKKYEADFQKKVDSINTQKQLTFVGKKELILKDTDTLKRPSYHL